MAPPLKRRSLSERLRGLFAGRRTEGKVLSAKNALYCEDFDEVPQRHLSQRDSRTSQPLSEVCPQVYLHSHPSSSKAVRDITPNSFNMPNPSKPSERQANDKCVVESKLPAIKLNSPTGGADSKPIASCSKICRDGGVKTCCADCQRPRSPTYSVSPLEVFYHSYVAPYDRRLQGKIENIEFQGNPDKKDAITSKKKVPVCASKHPFGKRPSKDTIGSIDSLSSDDFLAGMIPEDMAIDEEFFSLEDEVNQAKACLFKGETTKEAVIGDHTQIKIKETAVRDSAKVTCVSTKKLNDTYEICVDKVSGKDTAKRAEQARGREDGNNKTEEIHDKVQENAKFSTVENDDEKERIDGDAGNDDKDPKEISVYEVSSLSDCTDLLTVSLSCQGGMDKDETFQNSDGQGLLGGIKVNAQIKNATVNLKKRRDKIRADGKYSQVVIVHGKKDDALQCSEVPPPGPHGSGVPSSAELDATDSLRRLLGNATFNICGENVFINVGSKKTKIKGNRKKKRSTTSNFSGYADGVAGSNDVEGGKPSGKKKKGKGKKKGKKKGDKDVNPEGAKPTMIEQDNPDKASCSNTVKSTDSVHSTRGPIEIQRNSITNLTAASNITKKMAETVKDTSSCSETEKEIIGIANLEEQLPTLNTAMTIPENKAIADSVLEATDNSLADYAKIANTRSPPHLHIFGTSSETEKGVSADTSQQNSAVETEHTRDKDITDVEYVVPLQCCSGQDVGKCSLQLDESVTKNARLAVEQTIDDINGANCSLGDGDVCGDLVEDGWVFVTLADVVEMRTEPDGQDATGTNVWASRADTDVVSPQLTTNKGATTSQVLNIKTGASKSDTETVDAADRSGQEYKNIVDASENVAELSNRCENIDSHDQERVTCESSQNGANRSENIEQFEPNESKYEANGSRGGDDSPDNVHGEVRQCVSDLVEIVSRSETTRDGDGMDELAETKPPPYTENEINDEMMETDVCEDKIDPETLEEKCVKPDMTKTNGEDKGEQQTEETLAVTSGEYGKTGASRFDSDESDHGDLTSETTNKFRPHLSSVSEYDDMKNISSFGETGGADPVREGAPCQDKVHDGPSSPDKDSNLPIGNTCNDAHKNVLGADGPVPQPAAACADVGDAPGCSHGKNIQPYTDAADDTDCGSDDDVMKMIDEAGFVDVFALKQSWNTENRSLKKLINKYRERSQKVARLQQLIAQLKRETTEMRQMVEQLNTQTSSLKSEASDMRCTLSAVCDASAVVAKESEVRNLEPTCYRRYTNIRTPLDAGNLLNAIRNRVKALGELEVLTYRKQLVLHHVLPGHTQEKPPTAKRHTRTSNKGQKTKKIEESPNKKGNIVIEVMSPSQESGVATPSWSEDVTSTESPLTSSNPTSGSGEVNTPPIIVPDITDI